jgi:hypothetical protein
MHNLLKVLEVIGVLALFATCIRLSLKWAEWCGFGKGFPHRTRIQTLFDDRKTHDSN